jgi:hypothetical protein
MFPKSSVVLIVYLLIAIVVSQHSQGAVQAQTQIDYEAVLTEVQVALLVSEMLRC